MEIFFSKKNRPYWTSSGRIIRIFLASWLETSRDRFATPFSTGKWQENDEVGKEVISNLAEGIEESFGKRNLIVQLLENTNTNVQTDIIRIDDEPCRNLQRRETRTVIYKWTSGRTRNNVVCASSRFARSRSKIENNRPSADISGRIELSIVEIIISSEDQIAIFH